MSYMHIDNLYRAQEILEFRTCYALEKLHGTSTHIVWKDGQVFFSSGGEKHEKFKAIFNEENLVVKFSERFLPADTVVVYGEGYGGKCQGMSKTYGPELKFAAFEVKVNNSWLSVPNAVEFVEFLGLEFVDYKLIETTMEAINFERDRPSTQAIRNGILGEDKIREGVVLRPPFEVTINNGRRVIAKHKREEFAERGRPNVELDPSKREMLENAEAIAIEWVTPMRLEHVIDRLVSSRDNKEIVIRDTKNIIELMVEDVTREASGEIVDNHPARKAIGARAAQLFKAKLQSTLPSA